MVEIVLAIVVITVLLFGGVVLFGAPYLPVLGPQARTALDLLDMQPGETLLELGSGDGKVLLLAAQRGISVYGIELNPALVLISRWRTRKYRDLVTVRWGNFWASEWPEYDAIYIFGLEKIMKKLHTKIVQNSKKTVRLASVGFEVANMQPLEQKNGVFLYRIQHTKRRS